MRTIFLIRVSVFWLVLLFAFFLWFGGGHQLELETVSLSSTLFSIKRSASEKLPIAAGLRAEKVNGTLKIVWRWLAEKCVAQLEYKCGATVVWWMWSGSRLRKLKNAISNWKDMRHTKQMVGHNIYISIRAMTCFRIELEARCTEKATIQNRMNDEKKEQQSSCSSWTITLFFNLINCIRDMSERFSIECTMYTSGRAHTHTQQKPTKATRCTAMNLTVPTKKKQWSRYHSVWALCLWQWIRFQLNFAI